MATPAHLAPQNCFVCGGAAHADTDHTFRSNAAALAEAREHDRRTVHHYPGARPHRLRPTSQNTGRTDRSAQQTGPNTTPAIAFRRNAASPQTIGPTEDHMSELGKQIAELDDQWKHACDVATASIGQPDRAENVAYRDELATQLAQLKARAGSDVRR